jgi:hypothetical protein
MKLTVLRSECPNNRICPTVYATDRETLIVQGYKILDAEERAALGLPPGEDAVEIPRSLLPEVK